jgi:hypothetical protein
MGPITGRLRSITSTAFLAAARATIRAHIDSLFDAGYVTMTPELKFEVSRRIRRNSRMEGTITRYMEA